MVEVVGFMIVDKLEMVGESKEDEELLSVLLLFSAKARFSFCRRFFFCFAVSRKPSESPGALVGSAFSSVTIFLISPVAVV